MKNFGYEFHNKFDTGITLFSQMWAFTIKFWIDRNCRSFRKKGCLYTKDDFHL